MEALSSSSSYTPTSSSSQPCNYDVFLSFRGDDTRKKFVDHLSETLKHHVIKVYKDDEALPRGESIGPSLFKAIRESRIAVIILSKNYADSSWCLDELVYIMKCRVETGLIVMPIFYDVEPSEVRNQNGDFGKAFSKQEIENINKTELWRKVLFDVSNIAGWEPKNIGNGHESQVIKKIVDAIFDSLFPLKSNVDKDIVGMRTRLDEMEPLLDIGSGGVRLIGIWGVGGSGKTTLATSTYITFSQHFQAHCIVENVREESSKYDLKKLQEDMLSALFKKEVKVYDAVEGKLKIESMLCNRKVLVLLDDVDELCQLEALVGSRKWFGSGSRIIITSRNENLLKSHKVDHVCPVRLLSTMEAFQLFKTHAYNIVDPVEDYEKLSLRVVSYSAGLPLALKVLGSFLYDKDKKGWMSTLARLKDIPHQEIVKILKISYDGLDNMEKELFLDIVCFWRRKRKDDAMEIFEACGFHPEIGIEVLRQKALISTVDGCFDMHDLVQEMGHHIVRGEHHNNPETHSRVWKNEEINNMSLVNATMENNMIEAIEYDGYHHVHVSHFIKNVSKMKKLRYLSVRTNTKGYDEDHDHSSGFIKFFSQFGMHDGGHNFLSNELRYIDWKGYPAGSFPESFQPMKLVVLKLGNTLQKELWKGCKYLPHLKVLVLEEMKKLVFTPDFDGLPNLQKLIIDNCDELKEIHQSLGNHKNLENVRISRCRKLMMFPRTLRMDKLKELNLSSNGFSRLGFSLAELTQLKRLNLSECKNLRKLPETPPSLSILQADYCMSLKTVCNCFKHCTLLSQVSLKTVCNCFKHCTLLSQVSLMGGSIIKDSWRLLESILHQENFIENHSRLLLLQGLDIPKRFRPRLTDGYECGLILPGNWYDKFCGFMLCAVLPSAGRWNSFVRILDAPLNSDEVWKERDSDKYTLVWYVSFASLRQTKTIRWEWDRSFHRKELKIEYKGCHGIGVKLVAKRSGSGVREASTTTDSSSDYKPQVRVVDFSRHSLAISFSLL